MKPGGGWRWGQRRKGFSHGNTQVLSVLGHHEPVCVWKNLMVERESFPFLRYGVGGVTEAWADGESSSLALQRPALAF